MTLFYEKDLAGFLQDFGEPAIFNGKMVTVIYDNEFKMAVPMGADVEGSSPTAIALSSDIDGVAHGDTVEIRETTFKIVGIKPDGTGFTVLILSE
jgi:hypothetical protein